MTMSPIAWQRRLPSLLLAVLLHALVIVVFLRGLTRAGGALLEAPMLADILTTPPPSAAPLPPPLHAPRLPQAPPIPVLIPPLASLPSVITVPSPPPPIQPAQSAPLTGASADARPRIISHPLDTDAYYPLAARMNFIQGQVLLRVCVYSTGDIASISLVQSSGHKELDAAAFTVTRQTRWKPAMVQGKPVARCSPFRVDFSVSHVGVG